MSTKITRRAVEVVLEMLPKPGVAGVDLNSRAYWDLLGEHSSTPAETEALAREVYWVVDALGRGEFSVLDLSTHPA